MSASIKTTKTLSLSKKSVGTSPAPVKDERTTVEIKPKDEKNDAPAAQVSPTVEKRPVEPVNVPDKAPKSNKMMVATVIYERMIKEGKARKEIILSFVTEAGLTKAGASTYYQTIKNKK